ncbi:MULTISPECIES: MerR family transcriptional regulator [Cysteiniphilum]|uniref:MerR family transcriptional regulator n=1 Tax=Cysteiniphilum TaxID=2056696 RepID=UPI0017871CCA|nr:MULTISPECIES: MerR family transcriptional regulator [Cysteiniphilum]
MTESLYPIRYISEKTGVKPITLRAWEKRYNLITPQRTEKGHRLYSDDDIKTIQKTITLLNYGYAIREVPAILNEHDGHIVVRDKKSHHMVSFDKLNKLVKEYRIDASIKEIEDLMSLYSPESYAQIIHPAMMKSLNKDSFIHIGYAEVIKERIIDMIILRLYRNIIEKTKTKRQKVYIIGYRTAMVKPLVLHGLMIANILSAHGYEIFFCSGVSSSDSILELPTSAIKIIYMRHDDFYLNQLEAKLPANVNNVALSLYKKDNYSGDIDLLPSSYIELFEAFKRVFAIDEVY